MVVVGSSEGGLKALEVLLAGLPADFPLPVILVQHRRKDSDDRLATLLQLHSALPVSEAQDKGAVEPARVYLAPANYHLVIDGGLLCLSTEAPVGFARPSIDVLFESAADAYGEGLIGVILTGSSQDGARGVAKIKACGGFAVVQDPKTAESVAMPEAAIAAAQVDRILPLWEIAPSLTALCE